MTSAIAARSRTVTTSSSRMRPATRPPDSPAGAQEGSLGPPHREPWAFCPVLRTTGAEESGRFRRTGSGAQILAPGRHRRARARRRVRRAVAGRGPPAHALDEEPDGEVARHLRHAGGARLPGRELARL